MRSLLAAAVGADHVLAVGDFPPDYGHDESLTVAATAPAFVVRADGRGQQRSHLGQPTLRSGKLGP